MGVVGVAVIWAACVDATATLYIWQASHCHTADAVAEKDIARWAYLHKSVDVSREVMHVATAGEGCDGFANS